MWILQFLPNWIFYVVLFTSVIVFLIASFIKAIPQRELIQVSSAVFVLSSMFMIGAISNNDAWLARVRELETKVAEAEAKSSVTNTDIVEKTIIKTKVVRERGQDIIKYVDREIVKYDNNCIIPKEFVVIHNKAAEAPK